jgi:outer membrane protein assembly factor BamA/autotransporter translocation and assembly factor TamB
MTDPGTTRLGGIVRAARLRPWLAGVFGLALLGVLILVALHSRPVRAYALTSIISRLGRAGFVARADRLDYNLSNLDVRVTNFTLGVPTTPGQPFFSAREIRVNLTWDILFGRINIEQLDLNHPRITLSRDAGGAVNWPSGRSGTPGATTLRIERLHAADLGFAWHDARADTDAEVNGLSFDLTTTTAGSLKMTHPARVRWQDHGTVVSGLGGRLGWNGRDLSIDALHIAATEGTFRADGRVDALLGAPQLDLHVVSDTDLAAVARWVAPERELAGALNVDARLMGPPTTLDASFEATGRGITVAHLTGISVKAAGQVSPDSAKLTSFSAGLAGGSLAGSGELSFGKGPSHVKAEWQRLDLETLLHPLVGDATAFAARVNGSLDAQWGMPRVEDVDMRVDSRMTPPNGSDGAANVRGAHTRLSLGGSIAFQIQRQQWTLEADQIVADAAHVASKLAGRVNPSDLLNSSMAGEVHVTAPDLSLVTRAFDRPAQTINGAAEAHFTAAGTVAAPQLAGTVEAQDVQYGAFAAASMRALATATRNEVQLNDIEAELADTSVRGRLQVAIPSGGLDGRLEASVGNVADFASLLPAALHPEGAVEVVADLSGSAGAPRVAATIASSRIEAAGQLVERLDAELTVAEKEIIVERAKLQSGEGALEAHGRVDLLHQSYAGRVTADRIPIRPMTAASGEIVAPISGQLSGEFDGSGSASSVEGSGRLSLIDLQWADFALGRVDADLKGVGQSVAVDVRAPDIAVTAEGDVGVDASSPFSLHGRLNAQDIAELSRRLSLESRFPVSGAAELGFELAGTRDRPKEVRGTIDFDRLELAVDGQSIRLARRGQIQYDGHVLEARDVDFLIGGSMLAVSGSLGERAATGLNAALEGSLADLAFIQHLIGPNTSVESQPFLPTGTISLHLDATGTLTKPDVTGSLRISEGRLPLTPFVGGGQAQADQQAVPPDQQAVISDIDVVARYDAGVLSFDTLGAMFNGATLTGTARVPNDAFFDRIPAGWHDVLTRGEGSVELRVQVLGLTPEVAAPFVDRPTLDKLGGTLDASIALEADRLALDQVRGTVTLDRAELLVSGVSFDQQTPTRLTVHDGRVEVVEWIWGRQDNEVRLTGALPLTRERDLDLTARGALDLRLISAFVAAARTTGRADSEIRIGGRFGAPTLDGWVTFSNGELRMDRPRIVMSDLSGTITLDRDLATLHRITATLNGGDAEIAGSLQHHGAELEGELTLTGRDSAFQVLGLRAQTNADLAIRFEPRGPLVSGSVTIVRGAYREPLSLTGGLVAALQSPSQHVETEAPSALENLRLDVRLLTENDVLVDNNYARLSMSADLRLIGTAAHPALTGRATLAEGGLVFFGGRRYRLADQGAIDFVNPNRIEPDLDLRAVTRISDAEITLELKGPPNNLQTSVTSDNPSYSQSDLISLLVTGQTAASSANSGVTAGREAVLGLVTGELVGTAGRAIGFDTVRLEQGTPDVRFDAGLVATQTDPGTRLTFGKEVTRNVEVVFSQSLDESGGLTWIVAYKPRPRIQLQVVSIDDDQRLFTFQQDLLFGQPASARARTSRPQTPRVIDVQLNGAGADEPELRSRLKLKPGERFRFFRWQDDRERIEAFYHERERFEARVSTRRIVEEEIVEEEQGGPGVRLVYDIRPGPHTALTVEGFSFPRSVIKSMEAAWVRAVVEDFLVDEVEGIARGALVDRSFVRAMVAATIDSRDDEKRLLVRVEPGPRTDHRRVEFRGNQQMSSDRLSAVIAEPDLERAVWLDPGRLRDALEAFYRREGYLAASVRIDDIVISGDTAVRPIEINEGEAFRIRELVIKGAEATPVEDVKKVAALSSGDLFSDAAIDRARQAITDDYRKRGFNEVQVEMRPQVVTGAAQVDVMVTIEEGVQQRLQDIVITGIERTDRSLVSRALKLQVGQLVDLTQWYAARRRLYGTGAFRSVDIEPEPISPSSPSEPPASPEGSTPASAQPGPPALPLLPSSEQPVRAKVTLQEWPAVRFRWGLEVESQDRASDEDGLGAQPTSETGRTLGLGVASDVMFRNLFGRAITAGLAGRYARDFRAARAFATSPFFFGLPITTNAYVQLSREDLAVEETVMRRPVSDVTTLTLEQRIRPRLRTEVAYSYTFERNHTFNLDDPSDSAAPFNVARLGATALLDRRNDLVDANRGWFHSSSFEYSAPAFASDLHFVKYLLQQRYYRKLGPVVLASYGRLGLAKPFDLQTLIPSERFVAGGGNSVRGYAEDSLSPIDAFGFLGGEALLVLNQEVRFPIIKRLHGVGFFDAGHAFEAVGQIRLSDLAPSTGFGLRVYTPVVLVRIDYGVPLQGTADPKRGRWFFSIGQAF